MKVVELERVEKRFGTHVAVEDLTLAVPEGSVYGFIGPNGSGKTTTMRMITNILYPDRGTIRVFGKGLTGKPSTRIGYLPEERGLYKNMKLREVLRFYGELKSGRRVYAEVDAWLERLGLSEWANKKVGALSKGMSQKAQFIASVVSNPPLLILDEPFSGLDPVNTDAIRSALLGLREAGTTVIFSTHDMDTAEDLCDYILMIFKGRKVLDGTLSSIQERYGHDTIRLRAEGGAKALGDMAGVCRVNDFGGYQELQMNPNCDPRQVLQSILSRTAVTSFEVTRPSLHDIFVRIAGSRGEGDDS